MPNRRMFSNRIANSARFLQMPTESQLLYFHMVLRADDDGIVESYPLMKLLGMAPDNFKVLIAKRFITQLNEDQVIVIIDWTEHNKIRADRKVNSIYLPLLKKQCPELPVLKPEPRKDVKDNTKRISGGQSTDGISKVRLSKVKLGEVKLSKDNKDIATPSVAGNEINLLIEKFKSINPSYEQLFKDKTQRAALQRLLKKFGREKLEKIIASLPAIFGQPYSPVITTPFLLEKKLGDLIAYFKKRSQEKINFLDISKL